MQRVDGIERGVVAARRAFGERSTNYDPSYVELQRNDNR